MTNSYKGKNIDQSFMKGEKDLGDTLNSDSNKNVQCHYYNK
jgi:hypothetical protein